MKPNSSPVELDQEQDQRGYANANPNKRDCVQHREDHLRDNREGTKKSLDEEQRYDGVFVEL